MDSKQVKQAFAAAGIKVRVADQGVKFRICRIEKPGVNLAHEQASRDVAASLGLYGTNGRKGGDIQQSHEMVAYKPQAASSFFALCE